MMPVLPRCPQLDRIGFKMPGNGYLAASRFRERSNDRAEMQQNSHFFQFLVVGSCGGAPAWNQVPSWRLAGPYENARSVEPADCCAGVPAVVPNRYSQELPFHLLSFRSDPCCSASCEVSARAGKGRR